MGIGPRAVWCVCVCRQWSVWCVVCVCARVRVVCRGVYGVCGACVCVCRVCAWVQYTPCVLLVVLFGDLAWKETFPASQGFVDREVLLVGVSRATSSMLLGTRGAY